MLLRVILALIVVVLSLARTVHLQNAHLWSNIPKFLWGSYANQYKSFLTDRHRELGNADFQSAAIEKQNDGLGVKLGIRGQNGRRYEGLYKVNL